MEFLASKAAAGDAITEVMSKASKVRIASAFFCPGQDTLQLLNSIRDLTLVISEEYTINDPTKLEKLASAVKRSVPPDVHGGKLHAKVFIADMPDGTTWVLIGSANLTEQGLFYNNEVGVALTSTLAGDRAAIKEAEAWFEALFRKSRPIDMRQANAIWASRQKQRRTVVSKAKQVAPAYWAIKTTEGGGELSTEHWDMFERDSVVAIGWENISIDPSTVDNVGLRAAVDTAYPNAKPGSNAFAVRTIRDFTALQVGSIMMICRGYSSTSKDDQAVHIYAFAKVIGELEPTPHVAGVWRLRRSAIIQTVHKDLPVHMMRKLLESGSLMQTLHRLSQHTVEAVADELGIQIDV
jgi:HKD family nuclease